MRFSSLVIVVFLVLSSVRGQTAVDSFFPIVGWVNTPTEEALREMAECGITVPVFVPPAALDICEKVGLKALVQDERITGYNWQSVDEKLARSRVEAAVKQSREHPALYGYYVADEPPPWLFKGQGKIMALLREFAPDKPALINLYPNYAIIPELKVATYEEYLDGFIAECRPPILSYDHYALFENKKFRPEYWSNLEVMRRYSLKEKVPFWNIVLTTAHFEYREVNAADLRFQVFTTLAYGGRGLGYFTYQTPATGNYRAAPVDAFGAKTPLWSEMQNVNRQVKTLAPFLNKLKSEAVYHFGSLPAGSTGPGENSAIAGMTGGQFLVGEFTSIENERFVMIVNKSFEKSFPCEPQWRRKAGRVQMVSPVAGQLIPFSGEQRWLAPGQGVLLRVEG